MWKADTRYSFLLRVCSNNKKDSYSDYTAYFFAPEIGKWKLIAEFRRPKTSTYIKGAYSFLENLSTRTGQLGRMAYYGNQWVCNKDGKWFELVRASYTADVTVHKQSRMDYAGGLASGKNCFF